MSAVRVDRPRADWLRQALDASPLFSALPARALEELTVIARRVRWPAKDAAIQPRDTADRFFVIASGRMEVTRVNPENGRGIGLMLLGPGDAFDLLRLVDGRPFEGWTRSVEALETVAIPLETVRKLRAEYVDFARALDAAIGQMLRAVADLASELALHDTDTRLARFLRRQAVPASPASAAREVSGLSHDLVATMIGSVRVVVSRRIQELRREGVISVRRERIRVEDEGLLRQCCKEPAALRADGARREVAGSR